MANRHTSTMRKTEAITVVLIFITSIFLHCTLADFEVCTPTTSKVIYRFSKANCPFGVLFYYPITAGCLSTTNSEGHFVSDLCEPEDYMVNPESPYKVQLAFVMDEEPVDDTTSCSGQTADKCNTTEIVDVTLTTMKEPGLNRCDYEEEQDEELSEEDKTRRQDPQVFNQTERMFKYMLGLNHDHKEKSSDLRLFKLIRQSFRILSRFCDTRYVPADFGKDVLKAFMFLFRESDLSGFTDISVEGYQEIKKTLDDCEGSAPSFTMVGNTCKTCPNVYTIEKMSQTMRYIPNEFSFAWGKYDVPIDATWGTINFVHGLCYGTYKDNVNYHHNFQQEAERVFTKEIRKRWSRPPILNNEDLWDHLFSSNIKNTMRNLDACIAAAYHGTAFAHPLERPFVTNNGTEGAGAAGSGDPKAPPSRKKRALPMSLDDGGLEAAGWCFQTKEDLLMTTEGYVKSHCPNNMKAFGEVKEIVECLELDSETTDENGNAFSVENTE